MINYNILHLIIRKCMDLKPHPLARIIKPIFYEIETANTNILIKPWIFVFNKFTNRKLVIRLYGNIKHEELLKIHKKLIKISYR